jgi:MATE family multidrug resistance protein
VGSWPGIGIDGIAVSSVITYAYMGLAFGLVVLRNPVFACYKLFGAFERCDLKTIKPLLLLGFPTAGTMALESALFSTCAYLMGALGAADLAAHQSMFQLVMVSFIIPIGLTQGISMCVGQAAGAGEFDRVKHLGHLGQMMAVGWSLLTASIVLLAPNLLLALFLPEGRPGAQAARAIALSLTPLVALLLIFDAWQTVVNGILRALKDAHATLVIYSLGCWGVGIPLAWWLSRHGLGAVGVWVGMATGLACVSILLVWRFNHQTHALISGRKHL